MAAIKKKVEEKVPAKKSAQRSAESPNTNAKKRSSVVSKLPPASLVKAKRSVSTVVIPTAITPKSRVGKKPGPKSMLDDAMMLIICNRIAQGEAAYKVLASPGIIDASSFYIQIRENETYAKMYRDALERRGEKFADELTELCDEARGGTHEDIQALKLMVNTRQWVVSRLLPKKYGDKVVVAGDADNPLVTQLIMNSGDLVKKIKGVE